MIDFFIKGYIPQFLLNTQNSCIKDDPLELDRNPEAKHLLSSLESPLRPPPDATEEDFEKNQYYPADLFRKSEISNNRYGFNRLGWKNATDGLTEILECPAALQDVDILVVTIAVHSYIHWAEFMYLDGNKIPARLPGLMAKVLSSMPHLRRLDWSIGKAYIEDFAKIFVEQGVRLSSVKYLKVSAYSDFLVGLCPSLEVLEPNDARSADWRWKYWTKGAE